MNLCRLLLKGSPDHKNLFCTYNEAIPVLLHNIYLIISYTKVNWIPMGNSAAPNFGYFMFGVL
jgi:hypothetical protein